MLGNLYKQTQHTLNIVKLMALLSLPQLLFVLILRIEPHELSNAFVIFLMITYLTLAGLYIVSKWYGLFYEYKVFSRYGTVAEFIPKMWAAGGYLLLVIVVVCTLGL